MHIVAVTVTIRRPYLAENVSHNDLKKNLKLVVSKAKTDGAVLSPINLCLQEMKHISLPYLQWHNYDRVPKKMKLTNTGKSVILSGKWMRERSYLAGGPLRSSYVFSQIHFHWGQNDGEGSEHLVDGHRMPLEMHVMHFRSRYVTQEAALKETDGICVLAYLFKIQKQPNPRFDEIIKFLKKIECPHTSVHVEPQPLTAFTGGKFQGDYFLYWGRTQTDKCHHTVLWLVCRQPIGISSQQVAEFRVLRDLCNHPLTRNFREVNAATERSVFHVLPGSEKTFVLLQDSP